MPPPVDGVGVGWGAIVTGGVDPDDGEPPPPPQDRSNNPTPATSAATIATLDGRLLTDITILPSGRQYAQSGCLAPIHPRSGPLEPARPQETLLG